jgi:plasmid stabilization system protein ParE
MASQPQPPSPRRTDYTFAWLLLGVLGFAGLLVFSGIYVFSRYLVRQISMDIRQLDKRVEVDTAAGSLKIQKGEPTEAELRLPIYPGSRRVRGDGAMISVEIPAEVSWQVVSATYQTDDALPRVASFYRQRLGREFKERRGRSRVEFVMRDAEQQRRVIIWRVRHKTQIALANITEGTSN